MFVPLGHFRFGNARINGRHQKYIFLLRIHSLSPLSCVLSFLPICLSVSFLRVYTHAYMCMHLASPALPLSIVRRIEVNC